MGYGDNLVRLWDMMIRYGETMRYGDNMVSLWDKIITCCCDKIMIWWCDKIVIYGNIVRLEV